MIKQQLKRSLAAILSFSLVAALMPGTPASAADGDIQPAGTRSYYLSDEAMKLDNFSGNVLRFITEDASDSLLEANMVRVDFGAYNMAHGSDTYMYLFNYDPNVVAAKRSNSKGESWAGDVALADSDTLKSRSLFPRKFMESYLSEKGLTAKDAFLKSYMYINSNVGSSNQAYADTNETIPCSLFVPHESTTLKYDSVEGKVAVSIGEPSDSLAEVAPYLSIVNAEGRILAKDTPVYFASMYFATKEGKSLTEDTFNLYVNSSTYGSITGAYAMQTTDGGTAQTDVAFVGSMFTNYAEGSDTPVNGSVKFTVSTTVDALTTYMTEPEVTLTPTDGENTDPTIAQEAEKKTYSASSQNGLLTGTDVTDGTVTLPVGWYKWTVTPKVEADIKLYKSNSGWVQFTQGDTPNVNIYAQTIGSVPSKPGTYKIKLIDTESTDGKSPFKQGTEVSVTVDNGQAQTVTVDADGYVTISANTTSGEVSTQFAITGYQPLTQSIQYSDNNIASVSEVSMSQIQTTVTLTAKDSTAVIAGAQVTIGQNTAGYVTPNMAANVLPITKTTGANGNAVFNLPNGDYTYTITSGGNEDVTGTLSVRDGKVTLNPTAVKSEGEPNDAPGTVTGGTVVETTPAGDNSGNSTVTIPDSNTTVNEITDRLYYAEGTWVDENGAALTEGTAPSAGSSQMKVEVSLENVTDAYNGTFGLRYDKDLFELVSFTADSAITAENFAVLTGNAITNPTQDTGYHAFYWQAAENNAISSGAKLGTYLLKLKTGADYKQINTKSLFVQPYSSTLASDSIAAAYKSAGLEDAKYNKFISYYWRYTDDDNNSPAAGANRLDKAKASLGGFYQINLGLEDGAIEPSDIRTQYVFPSYGQQGIAFSVKSDSSGSANESVLKPGKPIENATVTVTGPDGKEYTGTTDKGGNVIISVPAIADYGYEVVAPQHKPEGNTGKVSSGAIDQTVNVILKPDTSHKVLIHSDSKANVTLLDTTGGAQNGVDYLFDLAPVTGKEWVGGKRPAADKLTITIGEAETGASPITGVTWDATAQKYKLDKDAFSKYDSTNNIYIKVDTKTVQDSTAQHKVVSTVGEGGGVAYTDNDKASSFDPSGSPKTGPVTVTETLAAGETESASYTYSPDFTVKSEADREKASGTTTYNASVIDKFYVNGMEVKLSDRDRIYGLKDFKLTGIAQDQSIAVTFGTANIKPNGGGNRDDDQIIGEVTPVGDPLVTVTVGNYGSAKITVSDSSVTDDELSNATKSYTVKNSGTLTAVVTPGADAAVPDGATAIQYEIDKVLVDGAHVTGDSGKWTSNTLTLSGIIADTHVIITFKPVGKPTNQAIVQVGYQQGTGSLAPITWGTHTRPVGEQLALAITPDNGYTVGDISLTEPGSTAAVSGKADSSNVYTTPALKEGTTTVVIAFEEQTFKVALRVHYGGGVYPVVPKSAATFTFVRTSGGAPVTLTWGDETNPLVKPANVQESYQFELPVGTWSLGVSKDGWLNYTISGFAINAGGTVNESTKVDKGTIYFGLRTDDAPGSNARMVAPTIGNPTWTGKFIGINDIAQVANGMATGASAKSKKRADIDESGELRTEDMTYVTANLGKWEVDNLTYADFMKTTAPII